MTYKEYVLDVFKEHHNSGGMDMGEIEDLISESSFDKIEKWLSKNGYDLNEYYL
ncbi:hypothetical protein [Bacillus infantis]|uniref:hypothetical protein n=1 Tax=Bacillus infantis TaxID=324767 RepID=UPI003CF5EF95